MKTLLGSIWSVKVNLSDSNFWEVWEIRVRNQDTNVTPLTPYLSNLLKGAVVNPSPPPTYTWDRQTEVPKGLG